MCECVCVCLALARYAMRPDIDNGLCDNEPAAPAFCLPVLTNLPSVVVEVVAASLALRLLGV